MNVRVDSMTYHNFGRTNQIRLHPAAVNRHITHPKSLDMKTVDGIYSDSTMSLSAY
jgi:hypothetical protein